MLFASDLLSRAEGIGKEVNQLVSQIADLNGKILVAESGGDVAADLRDQQGELVRQLSERVEVNVLHGSDGMVVLARWGCPGGRGECRSAPCRTRR